MADNYWTVLLISKGEREKTKKIFPFKSGATKREKTRTEYGIKSNVDYKFSVNWKSADINEEKERKIYFSFCCFNRKPGIKAYQHQTSWIKFNFFFHLVNFCGFNSITRVWYADLAFQKEKNIKRLIIRNCTDSVLTSINCIKLSERKEERRQLPENNQRKDPKKKKKEKLFLFVIFFFHIFVSISITFCHWFCIRFIRMWYMIIS